jgi:hypothetical protein
MELNSCISNQHHLEHAVRQLRAAVAALARQCAGYSRGYAGLVRAVEELGPSRPFLETTGAALERANADLAWTAAKLASS